MTKKKKKSSEHKSRIAFIKQNFIFNRGYEKLKLIEKKFLFNVLNSDKEISSKQFEYLKKVFDKYFTSTVNGIKFVASTNEAICKQTISSKQYRKNLALGKQFNN